MPRCMCMVLYTVLYYIPIAYTLTFLFNLIIYVMGSLEEVEARCLLENCCGKLVFITIA